jgi:hypothetical protein
VVAKRIIGDKVNHPAIRVFLLFVNELDLIPKGKQPTALLLAVGRGQVHHVAHHQGYLTWGVILQGRLPWGVILQSDLTWGVILPEQFHQAFLTCHQT